MPSSTTSEIELPLGNTSIESLPTEILRLGAEALAQHSHPYNDVQHDLLSCLLTSQALHDTAIPLIYRNVKFSKAATFHKFLNQIIKYPSLGRAVQCLDLSELGPLQALSSDDLFTCLSATPLLKAFLAPEDIDLSTELLRKLLCGLPQLKTLNFHGCNSSSFAEAFVTLLEEQGLKISPSIMELNLHGCNTLPENIFERLLPSLPLLRILDVTGTYISGVALRSLSLKARLTSLNISHCAFLSSRSVTKFLTSHPSVINSLVTLNAATKPIHEDATLSEEDLAKLLPNLPPTLKTLNLKNSTMTPEHLPALHKLAKQLEELNVGSDLRLGDLEALFLPSTSSTDAEEPRTPPDEHKPDTVLTPLAQAVAICNLHQRLASLPTSASARWSLKTLDISSMSIFQQRKILTSFLLGRHSTPLHRIELSEEVYLMTKSLKNVANAVGWGVEWDGRHCFLVRDE